MKIIIFLILGVAFLMFYQTNPLFAIIIVMLILGLYLFLKRRKGSKSGGNSTFRSGSGKQDNGLIEYLLLQQFSNNSNNSGNHTQLNISVKSPNERELQIEKTKKEILALFDE